MRRRARICLVASLCLIAGLAHADPAEKSGEIEDLDLVGLLNVEVSTASKTAESLDEAAAVITVVTRADIERWGYQSVAEVLQHTLGFYLIDDHILPNAGVRGMTGGLGAESGVIKVMIDGRSVAYRRTSGNWLGVELVPLESVAQIEIIRGPASALYGADAFLG
ncbi:MAG TPA: TonB-dependent receptor plug domain-containing protein, partial [Polyangiaceae bacterium]|nr:TonB-dependent receptor plug domain-containing protein [Polyangiaceae bacterium]